MPQTVWPAAFFCVYPILMPQSHIAVNLSVATAAAVVLITAAVVCVLIAASVVTGENEDKDDEKNPIAVAAVTEEHQADLLSPLPIS